MNELFTKPSPQNEEFLQKEQNSVTFLVDDNSLTTNNLFVAISNLKSKWSEAKTGISIGHPNIANVAAVSSIFKIVDVVILQQKFWLPRFPLSYNYFKETLKNKLYPVIESIKELNPSLQFYIKIEMEHNYGLFFDITDEEVKRHYYFLLQYTTFWINSGEDNNIILKAYQRSDGFLNFLGDSRLNDILTPEMNSFYNMGGKFQKVEKAPCWMKTLLKKVYENFQSIAAYNHQVLDMIQIDKCLSSASTSKQIEDNKEQPIFIGNQQQFHHLNLLTSYKLGQTTIETNLPDNPSSNNNFQINDFTLNFARVMDGFVELNFTKIFLQELDHLTGTQNKSIGCTAVINVDAVNTNIMKFARKIYKKCKAVWNLRNLTLVWSVELPLSDKTSETLGKMAVLQKLRLRFLGRFPDKKVHFWIKLNLINLKNPLSNLYCHLEKLAFNERSELIINFARIYKVPLIFKKVLDYETRIGWWSELKVADKLKNKTEEYPVMLARNYPEYYIIGDFPTNPCITWTDVLTKDGILLNKNYSGVSFYVEQSEKAPITTESLQLMFLFTFYKFPLVEIIAKTYSDVELVINVLSSLSILEQLGKAEVNVEGLQVYLQLPLEYFETDTEDNNNHQFLFRRQLSKLKIKISGIHFSSRKQSTTTAAITFRNLTIPAGVKTGLFLDDCWEEASNDFPTLQNTSAFIFYQINFSYLLCNIKDPIPASNDDLVKMEMFLDTQLYITKQYQRLFPNEHKQIELIFRVNPIPTNLTGEATENFLRFVSDTAKYAEAYKLRFFAFPAFDSPGGKGFGWWKITNFEDLANASVYVEKESELYGKPTWKPISEKDPPSMSFFSSLTFIIGTNVLIISVFAITALIIFVWYRNRFAFLTKEEVEAFRNGRNNDAAEAIKDLKFPTEFEIPRKNFLLLNILGQGNFGLVYNAKLTMGNNNEGSGYTQTVAVKMPINGASKESFKTMLAELKVLCYIGIHPHVIRFIGAHIKEIGKGELYIAVELCENGSLLDYLRNIKLGQKVRVDREETADIDIVQLNRFAHEICLGMEYIGERKIVHGDVSTRNILLDSNLACKIGDFGLSMKLYEYQTLVKESRGPIPWRWMALECLTKMEFTTKSDVWSYGVALWEIYSLGAVPYAGMEWTDNFMNELENGMRLKLPALAPPRVYEWMMKCWNINPEERPTFTDIASFCESLRNMDYVRVGNN